MCVRSFCTNFIDGLKYITLKPDNMICLVMTAGKSQYFYSTVNVSRSIHFYRPTMMVTFLVCARVCTLCVCVCVHREIYHTGSQPNPSLHEASSGYGGGGARVPPPPGPVKIIIKRWPPKVTTEISCFLAPLPGRWIRY